MKSTCTVMHVLKISVSLSVTPVIASPLPSDPTDF